MKNIIFGTSRANKIYIDTDAIDKVYLDRTLVWQNAIPVAKPVNTSVSGTYNGSTITNGYATPTGVSVSGTSSAINAGTYTATYIPDDGYIWADTQDREPVTVTLTIATMSISGATVTLNATSKTFNNASQSVSVSSVALSGFTPTYSVGGTTSATNVGTYTVTVTGTGNFSGSASATWTINKLSLTIPSLSSTAKNYNAKAQSPTVNNFNSTYETQSGTASATNGGDYTVTWSLKSTANTQWSDGTTGNKSGSWYIQYVWTKYNSVLTYSSTYSDIAYVKNATIYNIPSSSDCAGYCNNNINNTHSYGNGYSQTFNTSNGTYSVTPGQSIGWNLLAKMTDSGNTVGLGGSTSARHSLVITNGTALSSGIKSAIACRIVLIPQNTSCQIRVNGTFSPPRTVVCASNTNSNYKNRLYTVSSSYTKGGTSYGTVVNRTNSGAYPANGRASDGYWYVKGW